jgi:hypothetical protein
MSAPGSVPLEWDALRAWGLARLAQLAGSSWTDFNAHDPGVTILEQLCYALTDLGYRIDHPLPDLLARGAADEMPAGTSELFTAAQILTSGPVTLDDLRRLALDTPGVKNAWIEPVTEARPALHYHPGLREVRLGPPAPGTEPDVRALSVRGRYRVLVERSDLADIDGSAVRRAVARRLHAHRPLCEDFEDVRILEPQPIAIRVRLEIRRSEDPETLVADVLETLADYLSPHVAFKSLEEMRAAGHTPDRIFEGPALGHGFLDDAALRRLERRRTLYLSDMLSAVSALPQVIAVRALTFGSEGRSADWSLRLDPQRAPQLDLTQTHIQLERAGLPVRADLAEAVRRYTERRRAQALPAADARDLAPRPGRDRALARHLSILHHFPAVYGVGPAGLPRSAPPERRVQALQLKAYLLLLDQILAGELAQLDHAKDLLSCAHPGVRSYFAGHVDDPELGLDEVRRDAADHAARLDALTEPESSSASLTRKSRFLSHLLARFAEEGAEPAVSAGQDAVAAARRRVKAKQALLSRYPRISSARGTGVDYLADAPEAGGLEERLQHVLGLVPEQDERLIVIEHVLLLPIEEDLPPTRTDASAQAEPVVPFLTGVEQEDPYSLQLSFVFPEWPARFSEPGFWRGVEQTIAEHTPAHLIPHVRRLPRPEWEQLDAAYRAWLAQRRAVFAARLGL